MIVEKRGYIKEYDEEGRLISKRLKSDEEVLDLEKDFDEIVEFGDE